MELQTIVKNKPKNWFPHFNLNSILWQKNLRFRDINSTHTIHFTGIYYKKLQTQSFYVKSIPDRVNRHNNPSNTCQSIRSLSSDSLQFQYWIFTAKINKNKNFILSRNLAMTYEIVANP